MNFLSKIFDEKKVGFQNKVSSVTFFSGSNSDELIKLRTVEVESRLLGGWVNCPIQGRCRYTKSILYVGLDTNKNYLIKESKSLRYKHCNDLKWGILNSRLGSHSHTYRAKRPRQLSKSPTNSNPRGNRRRVTSNWKTVQCCHHPTEKLRE